VGQRGKDEIQGWQLGGMFTVLHNLNKARNFGYTNTCIKAKRSLDFQKRGDIFRVLRKGV
jgi:hypothetical protein